MNSTGLSEFRITGHLHHIALVFLLLLLILSRPLIFSPKAPANDETRLHNNVTKTAGFLPGIDVSHDQGQVDWSKVKDSGIQFVYHKASDGITWQDPNFVSNIKQLSSLNINAGPYHFFEAEDDPQKQADNFLRTISQQPLTLTPMVDVEITRDQSKQAIQTRLLAFLHQVEKATGCKPIIYSYKDFWQQYIGEAFNQYPFWLADYNATMTAPEGVKQLTIWQHSAQGVVPGIKGSVDLDWLLGGQEALASLKCQYRGSDHNA